jgi:spore coat protein A
MQLGSAERADVIIDFTGQAGKDFVFYNDASGPAPSGGSDTDFFFGNLDFPGRSRPGYGPDTRQVLRIRVVPATTPDPQPVGAILDPLLLDPQSLLDYGPADLAIQANLPIPPLHPASNVVVDNIRNLTLNEDFDQWGRLIQMMGTDVPGVQTVSNADPDIAYFGRALEEPATEVPLKDSIEIWYVFNNTGDVHPIHVHLSNLQILWRAPFAYAPGIGFAIDEANAYGPDPNELGWKETFRMNPGEVIALITKWTLPDVPFDPGSSPRAGNNGLGDLTSDPNYRYHEYVYHCHILEHEEHDMMRPLIIKEPKNDV